MEASRDAAQHEPQEALGRQVLIDLLGCDQAMLDDVARVEKALTEAARKCGATVVETVLHRFSPQGVSGVVVIAESHLAVHTWPEEGYAALDVFTCSGALSPRELARTLQDLFSARDSNMRVILRGAR